MLIYDAKLLITSHSNPNSLPHPNANLHPISLPNSNLKSDSNSGAESFSIVTNKTCQAFLQILLSRVSTTGSSFAIGTFVALLANENDTLDEATLSSSSLIQLLSLLAIVWMMSIIRPTGILFGRYVGEEKDAKEKTTTRQNKKSEK